jgi:hypothetical protein
MKKITLLSLIALLAISQIAFSQAAIGIKGTHTTGNYGALGSSTYGVYGYANSSGTYAVYGYYNSNGYGISTAGWVGGNICAIRGENIDLQTYGDLGSFSGVSGQVNDPDRIAINGYNDGSGNYGRIGTRDFGVYGNGSSSISVGVEGENENSGNYGDLGTQSNGVYGYASSTLSDAVEGKNIVSGNWGKLGTHFQGVHGWGTNILSNGVEGYNSVSTNWGAIGNYYYAVYGHAANTSNWAGFFEGKTKITGQLGVGTDPNTTYGITLPNSSTVTNFSGCGLATQWRTYSDSRLKSNQKPLSYGLPEIMRLKPKEYEQHSSTNENGILNILDEHDKTIGLIAQELHQVIPEAAFPPENEEKDLWSVDYTKLIPVLIKAIQEQQSQIETQNSKADTQKYQNNDFQSEIENLKSLIETQNSKIEIQQQQINLLLNEIKILKGDCDKPSLNIK